MRATIRNKIKELDGALVTLENGITKLEEEQHNTLRIINGYQKGRLIPFDLLDDANLYESMELAPGVRAYRIDSTSKELKFVCTFSPGAVLKSHYHDCKETIKIMEGQLHDYERKESYTNTHVVEYNAMSPHELYSPYGALIMVMFHKP